MRSAPRILIIPLFVILIALPLWAAPPFKGAVIFCSRIYESLGKLSVDTAIELEMPATSNLMTLFTTSDGTVNPVLEKMPPPAWLSKLASKKGTTVKKLSWDELSPAEQKRLINESAKYRNQNFFSDRNIHGLVIRDEIQIQVNEPIEFLGKTLDRGVHTLKPRDFLVNKVEFQMTQSIQNLDAVEIHFRTNLAAGRVSESATVFQMLTEGLITHQHAHVVVPIKGLRKKAKAAAMPFTDFFRRVNLFEEIVGGYEGALMEHRSSGAVTSVSTLNDNDLAIVYRWMKNGASYNLGDSVKTPWVGMHGPDKYDAPNTIGFQFRRMNPGDDLTLRRQRLSAIQNQMLNEDWGISEERIAKWAKKLGINPRDSRAMEAAWTRGWPVPETFDPTELSERAPDFLKKSFEDSRVKQLYRRLHTLNRGPFHIANDWSRDPLFFDDPKALEQIRKAQEVATAELVKLSKLKSTKEKIELQSLYIMNTFWRDSGIAKAVARSVKMDVEFRSDLPDFFVQGVDQKGMEVLRSVPEAKKNR